MSRNGNCPVAAAEEIAAVISALMNTSGGVLAVYIDASSCKNQVSLKESREKIVRIITETEKWIPGMVFTTFVKARMIEEKNELFFFINKTNFLITHYINAYHCDGNDIKPLLEYQSICTMLRGCSCTAESVCDHHLNTTMTFPSSVKDLAVNFEMPFSPLESRTWKYRAYSWQSCVLPDVLKSASVQHEIRKIVSALANDEGGSLLLGVTDTDTPVVRGYVWDRTLCTPLEVEELMSSIIAGNDQSAVSIWSNVSLDQKPWELFFHQVAGCGEVRVVLEIRVQQCVGGMFCAMPLAFVINTSGEVSVLGNFLEWKETMLRSFKEEMKANIPVDGHFVMETTETEQIVQSPDHPDKQIEQNIINLSHNHTQVGETQSDIVFQWWATDSDVTAESYRFDQCCARDLAAEEISTETPFTFFPSIESATEQKRDFSGLKLALLDIQERYKEDNGVGIIIENIEDPSGELNLITGMNQAINVVILRQNHRPVLISLIWRECRTSLANHYSVVSTCLLKRLCLLTYRDLCDRNTYLCFERQIYRIGNGVTHLEEKLSYPQEYLVPNPGTIDIVRYTLAGILLRCKPLVDRFGNIMVRHLSACQARMLLKRESTVTLVEGKAGSGKSVLALEIMRRIKRQKRDGSKIVFLCRGRGLAAFIKYQTEWMNIVIEVQDVSIESVGRLTEIYFGQYTDIFIDDAHSIPLTGNPNYRAMYRCLFLSLSRRPDSRAYIFFDPEMQDYRGCVPADCAKVIRDIAVLNLIKRCNVKTVCLGKNLRNSYRICQFLQANMGDKQRELQAIRNLPEDGIFFFFLQNHSATGTYNIPQEQTFENDSDDNDDDDDHFIPPVNTEANRRFVVKTVRLWKNLRDRYRFYQSLQAVLGGDTLGGKLQDERAERPFAEKLQEIQNLLGDESFFSFLQEHRATSTFKFPQEQTFENDADDGDGIDHFIPPVNTKTNNAETDDGYSHIYVTIDDLQVGGEYHSYPGNENLTSRPATATLANIGEASSDAVAVNPAATADPADDDVGDDDYEEEEEEEEGEEEEEEEEMGEEEVVVVEKEDIDGNGNTNTDEIGACSDGAVEIYEDRSSQAPKIPIRKKWNGTDIDDTSNVQMTYGHDIHIYENRGAENALFTRVHAVLAGNIYEAKDVTILTEGSKDKAWVWDTLQSSDYEVQEATNFPVQHIVVDTLSNFEGLDSPVIMFIVPEFWGSDYVGSLKYRLCIATRAISRLEFLVPWDSTGRHQDLLELRRVFGTEVIRI